MKEPKQPRRSAALGQPTSVPASLREPERTGIRFLGRKLRNRVDAEASHVKKNTWRCRRHRTTAPVCATVVPECSRSPRRTRSRSAAYRVDHQFSRIEPKRIAS